jgi:hypothetical protein
LTAEPRITASIRSPSARASRSSFSTITAQPSPCTKPSAAASKVAQRPFGDSIEDWQNAMFENGASITLTPPASAERHSPARRLWQA